MTTRKTAGALSAGEQQRYINVITHLNSGANPTPYAPLASFHANMSHNMHSGMGPMGVIGVQRFLS
jgi:hypothetical protein